MHECRPSSSSNREAIHFRAIPSRNRYSRWPSPVSFAGRRPAPCRNNHKGWFKGFIEMLGREVLEARRMHLESCIVHEHVERPKLLDRALNGLLTEFLSRDVARDEKAFPALGLDALLGHLGI